MRYVAMCTLLSLILASGCVSIPTEEACCKLIEIPSLDETAKNALASRNFQERDFPSSDWWEMFKDPQLTKLICLALSENPTMQKAAARVEAAEAEAKVKKSALFPTLGLSADVNWQYLGKNSFFRAFTPVFPANITEYEIDVNLQYELDFWGRNRNIFRSALGEAKADEAERQSAILVLSTSVASVYYKLQANMQRLEVLKEERKVLTRLFQLTKERLDNALDTEMQKLLAEEALYLINQNILIAENMVVLEKHMLNFLIGRGPESCEEIEKVALAQTVAFPLPKEISSNLVSRRPDLMAHLWRVEKTAHLVGAAKADFYPRIDLNALAGLDSVFPSKLFSSGSKTAQILPALYLPIFTAGRLRANLQARHAEFEEEIYAYNETVLLAVREVADQIVTLRTADQRLDIENRLVQSKSENLNLSVSRFKNALNNMIELLEAKNQFLQERFVQIGLQYDQSLAAIELIKALGGGYCTEEVPFD